MGKFIHAADIHLDSPLRGLERYEGAPQDVRSATRLVVQRESFGSAWLEKVKFGTTSRDGAAFPADEHLPTGFLAKYFAELEQDGDLMEQLRQEFRSLKAKLPSDLFIQHADLDLDNPAVFQEILTDVQSIVELKLKGREAGAHEN